MNRGPAITCSILLVFFLSCTKESFTDSPSARLSTSIDSLYFDTVFTATGSVAQRFSLVNNNTKGIHIGSVRLAGGSASPFKINVDGLPGPQVSGVDVQGHDSLHIFVTVAINPGGASQPFIVKDSIEIQYNGNTTRVKLSAYGQNAHFYNNRTVTGAETWAADLPYVITRGLTVAPGATLTISKGCRIYIHADAPLLVAGILLVNGGKEDKDRVIFTGDRLDAPYRDYPASYPGLVFSNTSRGSLISYAIIKNAYQAISSIGIDPSGAKLTLNETIIDNAYDAGLLAVNTGVEARNLLISNCGRNIAISEGGTYNFTHCTAVSFSNNFIQHKQPVLSLSNYGEDGNTASSKALSATFRNCIFWGDVAGQVTNEVMTAKGGSAPFAASFNGVLWRVAGVPANVAANKIVAGEPLFDSVNNGQRLYNFRLKAASPAVNSGVATGTALDLDGAPRPVGAPDLGAYERQ